MLDVGLFMAGRFRIIATGIRLRVSANGGGFLRRTEALQAKK